MDTLPRWGRFFFALSLVAFGFQNVWYKGFVKGLEMTPEWLPGHAFWAYLWGVALIAGGVSIAVKWRTCLAATLVAMVYFASVVLFGSPTVALYDVGGRTRVLESLTLGCGALVLAVATNFESKGFPRWHRAIETAAAPARVLIGISMVIFGLDHFQVFRFIVSLIPSWLPGATFWAAFTGLAFIAAGVSIITRWQIRLGTMLLGLMFFLWVLILHGPRVAAQLGNGNEWNSGFVALAICGVAWMLTGVSA